MEISALGQPEIYWWRSLKRFRYSRSPSSVQGTQFFIAVQLIERMAKQDNLRMACQKWSVLGWVMCIYNETEPVLMNDLFAVPDKRWVRQFLCTPQRARTFATTVSPPFSPSCNRGTAILIKSIIIYLWLNSYRTHCVESASIQILALSGYKIHDRVRWAVTREIERRWKRPMRAVQDDSIKETW